MSRFFRGLLTFSQRISSNTEADLDSLLVRLAPRIPRAGIESSQEFLDSYRRLQDELADSALDGILGVSSITSVGDELLRALWVSFIENRHVARRGKLVRPRNPRESTILATHRFDADTIWTLGRIGALFGRCLQIEMPDLQWKIGRDIVTRGYPVLATFPGELAEMNPTRVLITIANRHADDSDQNVLIELFRRWVT